MDQIDLEAKYPMNDQILSLKFWDHHRGSSYLMMQEILIQEDQVEIIQFKNKHEWVKSILLEMDQ